MSLIRYEAEVTVATPKPKQIEPTHEYVFTPKITFQFNNEHFLVRIVDKDAHTESEWFVPTMMIDLRKFVLLPHPQPNAVRLSKKVEYLRRRNHPMAFLSRWRSQLKTAESYHEFLEDLRQLMIYAQLDFRECQVGRGFSDGTGDAFIKQMLDTVDPSE